MHQHDKLKIEELLKEAFVLGEDIDDGIYDVAWNHLQKLKMIDATVDKFVLEEMKNDESVVPDAVNVLYEMEWAVVEAKKINYMPENVMKLRAWWKLYK